MNCRLALVTRTAILSASLVSVFTPQSIATAWVEVTLLNLTPTAVHVRATVMSDDWYGPCQDGTCVLTPTTLLTPIGSFTTNDPFGTGLQIPYGESWELSGFTEWSRGTLATGDCVATCTHRDDAPPITYTAIQREDVGHWQIERLRETPDTLYVSAQIVSDYANYNPGNGKCPWTNITMVTEPCIAWARLPSSPPIPIECQNGASTWGIDGMWLVTTRMFELALPRPGTYTIGGRFSIAYSNDSDCCCHDDGFGAYLADVVFNTESLAVQPTSWGRVKALYRGGSTRR